MIGTIDGYGSVHYDFDDPKTGKRVVIDNFVVSVDLGQYQNDETHTGAGECHEKFKCSDKFLSSVQVGDRVYLEVDPKGRIRSAMLEVSENSYMPIEV